MRVLKSNFGPIAQCDVPDKYFDKIGPDIESTLEKVFMVGGNTVGTMRLVRHADVDDGGEQLGWRVYVEVPFTGSFLHEVGREVL
jgi:hypothetical protein